MATKVEQVYGPNHWDERYYQSLIKWLGNYKFKRGVELGFAWSMSARAYLGTQDSKLISIDMNDAMDREKSVKEEYGDKFELMLGDSSTTLKKLPGKFDYIYIDGDHTYEGVKKDLKAAWDKAEKGAIIACDDYGNPCGVKQAVDEFVGEKNRGLMEIGNSNGGVYFER